MRPFKAFFYRNSVTDVTCAVNQIMNVDLECCRYIRSLQHSVAWGAQGGKSGSAFFKSFGEYSCRLSSWFKGGTVF